MLQVTACVFLVNNLMVSTFLSALFADRPHMLTSLCSSIFSPSEGRNQHFLVQSHICISGLNKKP